MQELYLFTLLLLSSAHRLSAEYDDLGHFPTRLEDRANDKGVWDKVTEKDEDGQGGVKFNSYDRQNVTSDESNGEDNKDSDRDFDDGKVSQETAGRITIKPKGTFSEAYGGFTNMTESNIITSSPHLIAERSANQCKFPTNLKESELDCTTYPSKVVCVQTCMFGYTLEGKDGIRRRMECNNEENRWKPVPEFEKCKPFVDCGVTIGPGGSYKCRKNYMHKGADCDIACSAYEDKEAVPTARYECDITGSWTPQLPFCARAGSGLKLVPVPHGAKQISDV